MSITGSLLNYGYKTSAVFSPGPYNILIIGKDFPLLSFISQIHLSLALVSFLTVSFALLV